MSKEERGTKEQKKRDMEKRDGEQKWVKRKEGLRNRRKENEEEGWGKKMSKEEGGTKEQKKRQSSIKISKMFLSREED